MDKQTLEHWKLFKLFLGAAVVIPGTAALEALLFGTDDLWFVVGFIYIAYILYRSWKSLRP